MNYGFAFEVMAPDGTKYRVYYKSHFVERYELDDPTHPAIKRRLSEEIIRKKIEEAVPEIDDVVYGKDLHGVIVSHSERFVMVFHAIETGYGYELDMITISSRIEFRPKSAKEVVIKVNPTFNVRFDQAYSFALKVSVLADISDNWRQVEQDVLYHLGGDLMDYWLERRADVFSVSGAGWATEIAEIDVS